MKTPPGPEVCQQFFERDDLLLIRMATVIDDNVHGRGLVTEVCPKRTVLLVANVNSDLLRSVFGTGWFNVNPVDATAGAKVVEPHSEASAAVDTDLDYLWAGTDESFEVPVVNVEVLSMPSNREPRGRR